MKRIVALALALALGGIAQASDDARIDPAKAEQIKTRLTAQGYDVRRIKSEDGQYEAYATKDGIKYEIYLDDRLEVVKTSRDD